MDTKNKSNDDKASNQDNWDDADTEFWDDEKDRKPKGKKIKKMRSFYDR